MSDRPKTTIEFLLSLANEINPPAKVEDGVFEDREFACANGWRIAVYYDAGELDYIDHFTSPTGEIIDFWEWPDGSLGRETLINWTGRPLHKTLDPADISGRRAKSPG